MVMRTYTRERRRPNEIRTKKKKQIYMEHYCSALFVSFVQMKIGHNNSIAIQPK